MGVAVKRLFSGITAFICLLTCFPFGIFAAPQEKQVIRIPCGINNFLFLDENGEATGYCKDYLDSLAKINNWEYQYIDTTWNEAVEMLERGELDILFPTNYTPEREAYMSFSKYIGGYTAAGLFASKNTAYGFEDYKKFDGAKIAITEKSSNETELMKYAEAHGFTYEPVYINSTDGKLEALNKGEVDLAVVNAANDVPDGLLVAIFDSSPFYYSVKKGNDDLLRQLNRGMQEIITNNNDLLLKTEKACLVGNNNPKQAYTSAEKKFIDEGKEIVIGFYKEREPLSYVNDEGEYCGIFPTLMNYVKENSGVNIVLKPIDKNVNWEELLAKKEIDFYVGASAPVSILSSSLNVTKTFIDYTSVLVTRSDCHFSEIKKPTVALTTGQRYWVEQLPRVLGDIDVKYYNNSRECLMAVCNGEADGSMLNNIEYNYQSKNTRFAILIPWENYRFNTSGGLVAGKNIDETKLSVMNKAIECLTEEYVDQIIDDNLNMAYTPTFSDEIYSSRQIIIIVSLIIIMIIVIFATVWIIRIKQEKEREKIREQEKNQLNILAALSHDYDVIYYTDLDRDYCKIIRADNKYTSLKPVADSHSLTMKKYIDSIVLPEYRDKLAEYANPKVIIEHFAQEKDFALRYQIIPDDSKRDFFEMHFVDASENENEHLMVFGVRCVDEAAKDERMQKQLLQDALESAQKASDAKSDFLSKMSHDIRTPMNAIIGMTAIASSNINNPEKVQDSLGKITSSSRHLLGLINEVLDMSKIESGTISLNDEEFNLSELISSLVNIIQPQIKKHNHKLSVLVKDLVHEDVIGDTLRIEQIFLNIMGNAVKYTPDGGKISLTVSEKSTNTPKAAIFEFVFEDNGIGMSEEYVKHIFEPFTRAEDVRISKIQGTGLGMSIAQNIVRMMNGTIEVESEIGKGSKFTVTIILKLRQSDSVDTSELADLPVIVVDDNKEACDSVCCMLDDIGMKSEGHYNGKSAVESIRNKLDTPDYFYAAIIDWKMPEMDGIETARQIKKLTDDKLPVIILSAYDWSEIEDEARAAGVDAFLSKPIFKSGLTNLFKRLKNGDFKQEYGNSELNQLGSSDYSDFRVLLVEDNELNLEISVDILSMTGISIDTAENGKIAVEKFSESEENYYDIILMDIQMPVMNGYEASKTIRGLGRKDSLSVPIVAMTANAFSEDIQTAKASGMNEHLAKPIDFNKLNDVLRKYLK